MCFCGAHRVLPADAPLVRVLAGCAYCPGPFFAGTPEPAAFVTVRLSRCFGPPEAEAAAESDVADAGSDDPKAQCSSSSSSRWAWMDALRRELALAACDGAGVAPDRVYARVVGAAEDECAAFREHSAGQAPRACARVPPPDALYRRDMLRGGDSVAAAASGDDSGVDGGDDASPTCSGTFLTGLDVGREGTVPRGGGPVRPLRPSLPERSPASLAPSFSSGGIALRQLQPLQALGLAPQVAADNAAQLLRAGRQGGVLHWSGKTAAVSGKLLGSSSTTRTRALLLRKS